MSSAKCQPFCLGLNVLMWFPLPFAVQVVQLQKYLEDTVGKNMNARRDKGHKDIDGLAGSLETVRSDLKKKEIQCSKAEAKVKDLNVQLQEARCGKAVSTQLHQLVSLTHQHLRCGSN